MDVKKERKKAFKRGSKSKLKKYEKRKANKKENSAKLGGLAAGVMGSGREDLGPELALISPARHSTLPLEGGGGLSQGFAPAAGPHFSFPVRESLDQRITTICVEFSCL